MADYEDDDNPPAWVLDAELLSGMEDLDMYECRSCGGSFWIGWLQCPTCHGPEEPFTVN